MEKAMFLPIDLSYELTKGFAARFIRYKVARLVERAVIPLSDVDDLEQELKLHLVRRFARFDPTLAHWNSFVVTVVERYILTYLVMRRRRRQLQFASLQESSSVNLDSNDMDEGNTFHQRNSDGDVQDSTTRLDLVMDVRHILSGLPEHTQRLCERLMIDSLAEVARQMQIPRTTLRGHILLLRNVFATALEQNRKKVSSLHRDLQ
jgi:RNA polymerase sigma-70 factor (ECF subfamily)